MGRDDDPIPSVERYLQDFWARGMSPASVESYARDLLPWFRFLWTAGRDWNRVTRDDVRDFMTVINGAWAVGDNFACNA